MTIQELIWPQDRIDHIAKHNVLPHEVSEVCINQSLVLKPNLKGKTQFTTSLDNQRQVGIYFAS